jgi:hypothetical protein
MGGEGRVSAAAILILFLHAPNVIIAKLKRPASHKRDNDKVLLGFPKRFLSGLASKKK